MSTTFTVSVEGLASDAPARTSRAGSETLSTGTEYLPPGSAVAPAGSESASEDTAGVAALRAGCALVAQVTAKVGTTAQAAFSTATTAIVPEGDVLPAGATPLAKGKYSIPVDSVSLPARLVVAGTSFAAPSLTVSVTDSRGYAVRGALVAITAPYGYVAPLKETATGNDGTVAFALAPKAQHPRAIVLYVRVRKPGDSVLAGVTAGRLVSVRIPAA